mmetsp:Transcript_16960/g.29176  ORF Transcript_16960/g.29176 Transcript_16960/m.29176 type:complete len:391 (+) Transcript_16960:769-1941(+)|eukprot:CAMPEP_0203760030 /NCGR_PEP_ID=MMETSP0098-20131031/13416_1 /ASSEMBLY_ACC=CAM_ASM_000208 /TAXON_ID=96639 /ORGANISM=" , Strain NY0313808BC1" /LENGTH=390 /DNA_ID=CAMNT_0050653445 /DNA_START=711 /DNA_END=1883 /DNA_ORIENTATION=+
MKRLDQRRLVNLPRALRISSDTYCSGGTGQEKLVLECLEQGLAFGKRFHGKTEIQASLVLVGRLENKVLETETWSLNLNGLDEFIEDSVVEYMVSGIVGPRLEVLNLAGNTLLCNPFPVLSLGCLRELNLSHCIQITNDTVRDLLKTSARRLKVLKLSCCYEITDKALLMMSQSGIQLDELDISGCSQVGDAGLGGFLKGQNLVGLDVSGLWELTDDAFRDSSWLYLRWVKCTGCVNLGDLAIRDFLLREQLESLHVAGIRCLTNLPFQSMPRNSSLKELNVNGCMNLDDGFVFAILECAPELESLQVDACPRISKLGQRELARWGVVVTSLSKSRLDDGLDYCDGRWQVLLVSICAGLGLYSAGSNATYLVAILLAYTALAILLMLVVL